MHTATVTVTNSRARVVLCSCGWIGSVHPLRRLRDGDNKRPRVDVEGTEARALAEWSHHNLIAHRPLIPLQPQLATDTVTHRGRWGHP